MLDELQSFRTVIITTGNYCQTFQDSVRRLHAVVPCAVSRDVSALHFVIGARMGNWKPARSVKDKVSRQSSFSHAEPGFKTQTNQLFLVLRISNTYDFSSAKYAHFLRLKT